ncbi:MAG: M20 family peptidase [Draconibacterium sp.]
MKKALKFLGFIVLVLAIVLLLKTFFYFSKQLDVKPAEAIEVNNESICNLAKAITFKTVSHENYCLIDTLQFTQFHAFLDSTYPLIFEHLEKEVHGNHALLYKWQGQNSNLNPLILLAHQDVVPAVEENWEKGPFSGEIDNEFIWGRGTLDDKGSLISILEAVERLLKEGFVPERTIYLASGDDEEILGKGAMVLAAVLKSRGVEAEMVLDEGMVIASGIVPMISQPVALIGTSEKGYLSVELTSKSEGGHSSMPESETAISILSKALVKITDNQPAPEFTPPVRGFLSYIGPEISWPARIVFANQWLLGGVLKSIYTSSGPGNALVRTTTAPTILKAGIKDNVLPTEAMATVNFRLLPGDTSEKVIARLNKEINDDVVSVTAYNNSKEPAEVSPIDCEAFNLLNKTIRESFDNTYVSPTLMTGSSDSYYYSEVSPNIYRFAPYMVTSEDLSRVHGNNERITIENYKAMINFYYWLMKNFQVDFD